MNKKYIPGVIVVEGAHDVSKLSTLYKSVFVVTNGYEVPEAEINFLKVLKKDTQIIILTDKDEAGEKIRERINTIIGNAINVEVEAPKSNKKKGVAECELSEIEKALDKYTDIKKEVIQIDLYKLGIVGKEDSKELRRMLSNKFNLGLVNKNNMITRLHLLGITEKELMEEIQNATSR